MAADPTESAKRQKVAASTGWSDEEALLILVSNLPPPVVCNELECVQFFNGALLAAQNRKFPADDVIRDIESLQLPVAKLEKFNNTGRRCIIRLRAAADLAAALQIVGVPFCGYFLFISKVSEDDIALFYNYEPPVPKTSIAEQLTLSNIARDADEEEVQKRFEAFGTLKEFHLFKDNDKLKGVGFCAYEDQSVNQKVIADPPSVAGSQICVFSAFDYAAGLQALAVGGLRSGAAGVLGGLGIDLLGLPAQLTCSSNVTLLRSAITQRVFRNCIIGLEAKASRRLGDRASPVVQLLNCVYPEDLIVEEEYISIVNDISEEVKKFGEVLEVVVPRPPADVIAAGITGSPKQPGVGKVFLRFVDVLSARKAQFDLNGRTFDHHRVICASFYPLEKYLRQEYILQ